MNEVEKIMAALRVDSYAMEAITQGHQFGAREEANLREAFREMAWTKVGFQKPGFEGVYRRDATDEEIYQVGKKRQARLDADEGLIFQRQLEEIDPRRFEMKYKPLDLWKNLVPTKAIKPGVKYITYRMYDTSGEAQLSSSGAAADMPMANAEGKEYTNPVIYTKLGYYYTAADLREAAFAGVPLPTEQLRAVDRGYKQKDYKYFMEGDSDLGLKGFLNHTSVPNTQAAAAAGGSNTRTWDGADKTPDEILADIGSKLSTVIRVNSQENFGQTGMMLGMPRAQFDKLAQTPRQSYSDTTILGFLLAEQKAYGIRDIVVIPDCAGAGTGTSDMAIMWPYDQDVVECFVNENPYWMPMQVMGLTYQFGSEKAFGGVVVRYPNAMAQIYGI
jgi:hypothetical protein